MSQDLAIGILWVVAAGFAISTAWLALGQRLDRIRLRNAQASADAWRRLAEALAARVSPDLASRKPQTAAERRLQRLRDLARGTDNPHERAAAEAIAAEMADRARRKPP